MAYIRNKNIFILKYMARNIFYISSYILYILYIHIFIYYIHLNVISINTFFINLKANKEAFSVLRCVGRQYIGTNTLNLAERLN